MPKQHSLVKEGKVAGVGRIVRAQNRPWTEGNICRLKKREEELMSS